MHKCIFIYYSKKRSLLEILGYIACLILLYSLIIRNILRTRCLNFIGWILLGIYGITIGSYPILYLGILFALYNIYYVLWVKLGKGEKFFRLIYDSTFYGKFTKEFIKYHKKELEKFFPDVDFNDLEKKDKKNLNCCFVFRDMAPIGIFVYKRVSAKTAEIIIDYTEHKYSNLIEACFLTRGQIYLKENKGITQLITYTAVPSHVKYLEKQGFIQDDNELFKFSLEL